MIRVFRRASGHPEWRWPKMFCLIFVVLAAVLIVVVLGGAHYSENTHVIFPRHRIFILDAHVPHFEDRVHALTAGNSEGTSPSSPAGPRLAPVEPLSNAERRLFPS